MEMEVKQTVVSMKKFREENVYTSRITQTEL